MSRAPEQAILHVDQAILHVDMDAFYASVELARRPELRSQPMWVGGAERGVVLSANYLARQSGVRSGMPSSRARRLCPRGVPVPPDFDTYSEVSKGVLAIFQTITAHVEPVSIDEAFLDVTGSTRRLGDARRIAEQIRIRVADEQQIPCSVGVAPCKFVAKIASKQAKPDGLVEVTGASMISFLHPLPVDSIWGVGEVTAARLRSLGLTTIAQVAHTPKSTLQRALGSQGAWLHDLAWGRDDRIVSPAAIERSIGAQETFSRDTDDAEVVITELLRMAARTASRMRQAEVLGRAVSISVRFADFTTVTRTTQLSSPTDVTDEIFAAALRCWSKLHLQRARIRRVGVRVEKLVDADQAFQQFTLDSPERGMREAEKAADAAILRFGPTAVRRARLTGRPPGATTEPGASAPLGVLAEPSPPRSP